MPNVGGKKFPYTPKGYAAAKKAAGPAVMPTRGKSAASKGVSGQVHSMGGKAWGASKKAANAAKRTTGTPPAAPSVPSLPSKAAAKAVAATTKPKKKA